MAHSRLRKSERLTHRKSISALFADGLSVRVQPLRFVFRISPSTSRYPARVAVSVPRKLFKHAVDRNLLKRRIREAYRLNKQLLYEAWHLEDSQLSLMIIYTSDQIQSFDSIERALVRALDIIVHKHIQ
ncbi:MAG: ribonuclease P protein component [Anaerolineales bacterium]|nr:ribonuclease P protein component [Anaerolineales bacterium]